MRQALWAVVLVCACARQPPPRVAAEPQPPAAPAQQSTPPGFAQPPPAVPPGHPAPGPRERRPICDPASPCRGPVPPGGQCGHVSAGCPGVYVDCACEQGAVCTNGTCMALADAGAPPPTTTANACHSFDHAGYDQTQRDIQRLSVEAMKANREVMQKYGRNDGPQARAKLDPILQKLSAAQVRLGRILTGGVAPVRDTKAFFRRLRIPTSSMGRPDAKAVDRYVTRRTSDGTLDADCARELRFVIDERTRHITNPASRGAPVIAQNVAQSLVMFGVDH